MGTSNSFVEFTPILANGTQLQYMTLSDTVEFYVGGELKVLSTETTGRMSISYTIEVNYQ